jgi:perosamine synthetase
MTISPNSCMPALLGGPPVRPQGPPPWPIRDEDIRLRLQAAYEDGSWGRYFGPNVELLEEGLANYHGSAHALTCGSGTFAVELALRALKIGPGEEVVLAGYDYEGNFLSVHAIGALPVLADIHPSNWNVSVAGLDAAIGPRTKAMIVSHLHGGIVPMRDVMNLAQERGLAVIEDAAQASGAIVQGRKAGAWGDVGILSFGGSKLLTAGRGGAILTPHREVHQRLRTLVWRGNHICPMSELQAAVLLPQLVKLDARNARRAANVALLWDLVRGLPGLGIFLNETDVGHPAYYKAGFQYEAEAFGLRRDRFTAALQAEGIAFSEGLRGLHAGRSPKRFRRGGELAEVEKAHQGAVVLHHPVLLGEQVEIQEVALALRKTYANSRALR